MNIKDEQKNHNLLKRISPFDAWALAFGGIIGYGAFAMPGTTFLKNAGVLGTLIAMQLGALTMLIISYAYGYMAKKFQVTGGQFIYAERAFGKKHGFWCAWFLGLCYLMIIPMDATALSFFFRTIHGNFFKFGHLYDISEYHVYFGEFLVSTLSLIFFAFIISKIPQLGALLQNAMVLILLLGILIILSCGLFSPETKSSNFEPLFYPDDRNPVFQILSVLVVAPWAFVGFDIVAQVSEETNFSQSKVKVIMDTCILASCFVYVAMTFLAASVAPSEYSSWGEYVNNLDKHDSFGAVMTFFAAYKIFGLAGLFIIEASAVCAVLTGIIAFYIAASRLLYSMAREKMLPAWFGVLNKNGTPSNAVLFCTVFSILTSLLGRHALGWAVDIASIGGAIGFAYTSLAAYKYSLAEHRKDVAILGMIGFIFSVIFALLLLVPLPGISTNALSIQSYLILAFWIILGVIFYYLSVNHRDGGQA